MNTVLTFRNDGNEMNLTHRSDEFRFVLKSVDGKILISRLSLSEIHKIEKRKQEVVGIDNCIHYPLQHSEEVLKTILDFGKMTVTLEGEQTAKVFTFSNSEWEQVIDYMYHGQEGRVLQIA